MSSAIRSKNVSFKPSGNAISGYNPVLGKFHAVDTSAAPSVTSPRINSRSSSIDETNDLHKEFDTVSNNSSWSGDSEDHKDKPHLHIPPLQADNEKREKIRLKNEKKHQRQKERRAQELHDRCAGFLMSRKLDTLSQQLVVMGFSSERATMALIMNQGKIEESISWLIKDGEGANNKHKEKNPSMGNLKVDISEELARIADMEIRYKCSKQDIERAVVACEGDLGKTEEILSSNQNSSTTQSKPNLPTLANKKGSEKGIQEHQQETKKTQPKSDLPPSLQKPSTTQRKPEAQYKIPEKDYKNQQMGKQDQVVLMQRPQSGNVANSASMREKRGNSPTLSAASSLGLFSWPGSTGGSSGLSSPVDWNSVGSLLMQFDYTNVDWTLNLNPARSSSTKDRRRYDPYPSARSGGIQEWSSPFEERDIFTLPRQFVSPSL